MPRGICVEGPHAILKQDQRVIENAVQLVPALALRQGLDAEQQPGQRDGGDIQQKFLGQVVQPNPDVRIRSRLHRLGHAGGEDDHTNLGGSAGVLSRTLSRMAKSSSLRPIFRPMAARASPTRTRFSGLTAAARISRTSASVLRPCCAARTRKARCTSSGTLLIVRTAMTTPPFYTFPRLALSIPSTSPEPLAP